MRVSSTWTIHWKYQWTGCFSGAYGAPRGTRMIDPNVNTFRGLAIGGFYFPVIAEARASPLANLSSFTVIRIVLTADFGITDHQVLKL